MATGCFAYTAFVIDAFAGRIVGWECSTSQAHRVRGVAPSARPPPSGPATGQPLQNKTIHHSDSEYVEMPVFPGFLTRTPMDPSGCWCQAAPGHPDPHFRLTTCVFPRICRLPGAPGEAPRLADGVT